MDAIKPKVISSLKLNAFMFISLQIPRKRFSGKPKYDIYLRQSAISHFVHLNILQEIMTSLDAPNYNLITLVHFYFGTDINFFLT